MRANHRHFASDKKFDKRNETAQTANKKKNKGFKVASFVCAVMIASAALVIPTATTVAPNVDAYEDSRAASFSVGGLDQRALPSPGRSRTRPSQRHQIPRKRQQRARTPLLRLPRRSPPSQRAVLPLAYPTRAIPLMTMMTTITITIMTTAMMRRMTTTAPAASFSILITRTPPTARRA